MKKKINKQIVFVGLSGGVDSAVSAALLKQQGYEVVGVFIKTWHPDFLECNEEEERKDAMRVAAHLDIPFLTLDLESVYKKEVADYMIREYKAGRTPNPDVMCNKEVKFGAFLKFALAKGADFVATGHYARLRKHSKNSSLYPQAPAKHTFLHSLGDSLRETTRSEKHILLSLNKSIDPSKDQSYFLWTLNQKQLSKIIFPIGHLKKIEVRKLAKKLKLPVAEKHDSQGICFLGPIDLKEFLKHYIKEKKGKVLDTKGEIIGYHNGAVFHTLGERHGFTITKKSPNDKAYYIVGKDVKKNILIVSQAGAGNVFEKEWSRIASSRATEQKISPREQENYFSIALEQTNWISEIPKENKSYAAQIRYHGEFLRCKIKIISKTKAEIIFTKPTVVAPGQSIVVYDGSICLGGGVVR